MPHPGLLHPEPLPLRQATADPYLHRRHCVWVNTVWAQPLWGLQVLVWTRYVWALQVSLLSAILPLLLSCWGYSFALGHGVSYFGGMQHSPIDSCSAGSCNFGVLAGVDEHTSFYSAIFLHHTHKVLFFFFFFLHKPAILHPSVTLYSQPHTSVRLKQGTGLWGWQGEGVEAHEG